LATLHRSLVGLTIFVALACSRHSTQYVIGAAGPQQLAYGKQNQRGIDLAVAEINRAGGIHGVPLRVVVRDDKASGVDAAKVAAEFVANRDVIAVVGHVGSGAMVSAARVYHSGGLPAIGTAPSSPDLTGMSPWVFRMITSDSVNGVTLARFASSLSTPLGRPVRAAVLYINDAYGRGLAEAFERSFQGDIVSADPVGTDEPLEPYVAYYKRLQPDVIFAATVDDIGIPLLDEARRQHLTAMFLGGDGWQGVVTDSAAEGVYVGTPFTAQNPDTAVQRFVAAFQAQYGVAPDAYAALAYDATKLVAQAIAAVGPNRKKVRAYLASLRDGHPFHGVTGVTHFASTNDPLGNMVRMTQAHHGLLIPVTEAGIAGGRVQ
jgi:branched-chain amino acid transport system substrate-binding protein